MGNQKAKDIGYALIKGAIGALPYVGAPASELLSVLIGPPMTGLTSCSRGTKAILFVIYYESFSYLVLRMRQSIQHALSP